MPHGHIHSCLKSSTSSRTRDTGPQVLPTLTSTAFRPSGRILLTFHIPSSCRPRVAIIGSREQLCIHPEVSKKESNSEKVGDGTPTEKKTKQSTFLYTQAFPRAYSTSSQLGSWSCTNLTPLITSSHGHQLMTQPFLHQSRCICVGPKFRVIPVATTPTSMVLHSHATVYLLKLFSDIKE